MSDSSAVDYRNLAVLREWSVNIRCESW